MLPSEALDILGLRAGATPVEVKEAYRDLVKVWHPDRFGSDARLRQKAEERVKQINDAYRVLQSRSMTDVDEIGSASRVAHHNVPSPASSRSVPIRQHGRAKSYKHVLGVGRIYFVGVVALFLIAYVVFKHAVMNFAPSPALTVEVKHQAVNQVASTQRPAEVVAGKLVEPKDSSSSNHSSLAQFHVRSLSDKETAQLETACSKQKELEDQTAYQTCLSEEVNKITGASEPDLSALSGSERESIESACSKDKHLHGLSAYNRCLAAQVAELAAEPARPDLSALSEADRNSIEAACKKAKYQQGPSAYNRCRAGFAKALTESRK